jgi:hypothetical protein
MSRLPRNASLNAQGKCSMAKLPNGFNIAH